MKNNRFYLLFGISVMLILLDYFSLLTPFKTPFEVFAVSVKSGVFATSTTIGNFGNILIQYSSIEKAFEERDKLKKENEEAKVTVEALTQENTLLRNQLQAPLPPSYQFIPAYVVGVTGSMELAAGLSSGIAKGMTVVDGATLIGKVTAVSGVRSTVVLPWSTEITIPAKTSRGAKGTVIGQLGDKIILDQVLQKDQLFLSDVVTTTGEGGFPPNLLIGKISHITTDDVSVYKTAQIIPAADYKKERLVFIISAR